VPYGLPTAGQAVAIGVNTASDVRPPAVDSYSWAYALFNCYGTGTFVPDYSSAGAYVIGASGGHNCPAANIDAAIFDFADATWKRLANANGKTARLSDYSLSETTAQPYFELTGASAGQIPSPAHLYQSVAYVPSALGGGGKGSYLMMGSAATTVLSGNTGGGIHRLDLSTGLWSRVTNDTVTVNWYSSSVNFDPQTKRYYLIDEAFHTQTSVPYLDATDWRVKRTATYPYPADFTGGAYQTVFFDPVRRLLLNFRVGYPVRALDLNNVSAGWVSLKMAGTQPNTDQNRWVFYEPDGTFYTRGNNSGQTLSRLIPPSGDWKTGNWTYSSVTVAGATLPDHTSTGGTKQHYGTFFYVPALRCLAWIAGESSKVILLKPN
jgi:hypothetical protein